MGSSDFLNTELRLSAGRGLTGSVVQYLKMGADPRSASVQGVTALMSAAEWGKVACMGALLPVSDWAARDCFGRDPLMFAARSGSVDAVRLALGASPGMGVDEEGRDALMHAAMRGHLDCVALLASSAKPGAKDAWGNDAVELAQAADYPDVVDFLKAWRDAAVDREQIALAAPEAGARKGRAERL